MILDQNGHHDLPPGKIAAVTTHLEMRERPPARPAPPRPDLALRRVGRADPAWYRDLYRQVGGDWLWFSRLLMADAELTAILHDPGVELWALERAGGGPAVGVLELDRREPGQVELAFFGLVADEVGGGAGRLLMNHAIERAFGDGPVERFWVHTCTLDHPKALEFYIRSGFVPYHRSVEVADDPRIAGVLPRTAAPWLPLIG